jgi:hypothetical protein
MSGAAWAQHVEELTTRIGQLDDELEEYGHPLALHDNPITVLRAILADHAAPEEA